MHHASIDETSTLDDALERLAGTAPEYAGGLSNHGPMAVEALVRLGRGDAVAAWVEQYAGRLEGAPGPGRVLGPGTRGDALGRPGRYRDWVATFGAAMADAPWQTVLADTLPVLVPGAIAAATHCLIRTGHAVRALEEADTQARRGELCRALAYWASVHVTLPGTPRLGGTLGPPTASRALPLLPFHLRHGALITDEALAVGRLASWEDAVDAAARPSDVPRAFSQLTREFAGWYLAEAEARPIAFVHGVTAPAAARLLLPYVLPEQHGTVYAYAWQACASLRVAMGTAADPVHPAGVVAPAGKAPERAPVEDLADRAVWSGDAHAIKLTAACLAEGRLAPDPVYVLAARDATERLAG